MVGFKRIGALVGMLCLVGVGVTAMPGKADAWWRGGCWGCGIRFGLFVPPVVVAPAPVYVPPPVYYAPPTYYGYGYGYGYAPPYPRRAWIPGHYVSGRFIPGHWS